MSSPSDNPKRWLEEELRDVPVPEGLRARLKGIAAATDEELDIALRSVTLPVGLANQLKSIPADETLDRRLKEVPIPAHLSKRLHEIAALSDRELDTQLTDVEVPAGLAANLRGIAQTEIRTRRARWQMVQWVVAASLLITVSLAYMAVAGNMVMAMFQGKPAETELELQVAANDAIKMDWFFDIEDEICDIGPEPEEPSPSFLDEPAPVIAQWEVEFVPLAEDIMPESGLLAEIDQLFSPGSKGYVNPLTDLFLAKHDFLATPVVDSVPVLQTIDALPLRGVTPPLVPAAKFQTLIVEGKSPLVSPSAHPLLRAAQVPLSCSTLGYDLAWRELLAGRIPDGNLLRTEDFLAGLNYDFELPRKAALGLRTAAGPAPFAEGELSLLQIGVPAAAVPQKQPPVQLTLAIDGSVSMTEAGQFAQLRRVLSQLASVLGSEDRLSVVLLGETTEVLLEDASPEGWQQLDLLLNSVPTRNGSNLAGGLREAALVARRSADGEHRQRLVLVTDGLRESSPAVQEQLNSMASDLAVAKMPVDVLQLMPLQGSIDTGLRSLAQAGEGRLYTAESAEAIRSSLVEVVAGPNQVVARGAKLKVEFVPEVVAEYRLVGHEPNGSGGLLGGPLEVNLYAGQTATALFEVKLKPTGGDEVAIAELTWIDAKTGRERKLRQKISRLQFATSVLESPVSLQRAAVAAQAAEVLRLSRSSSARTSGLRRLDQHADQLPTHTRRDPAFQQMLRLIDAALQVQTGRVGS